MSPTGIPKIRGPKRGATSLEGAEKCPRCGALQDLKDKVMTIEFEDDPDIACWFCHACGHPFRVCNDRILEKGFWPIRTKAGTYKVELKI